MKYFLDMQMFTKVGWDRVWLFVHAIYVCICMIFVWNFISIRRISSQNWKFRKNKTPIRKKGWEIAQLWVSSSTTKLKKKYYSHNALMYVTSVRIVSEVYMRAFSSYMRTPHIINKKQYLSIPVVKSLIIKIPKF